MGSPKDILLILAEQSIPSNPDGTLIQTDWEQSLTVSDQEY